MDTKELIAELRAWIKEKYPMPGHKSGALLRDAADELERLAAIVERLPKTADGVVPEPPCELWEVSRVPSRAVHRHTCLGWAYDNSVRRPIMVPTLHELPINTLYSTHEAALAAKEARQ